MTVIMVVALVLRFISRAMLPKSARDYGNSLIWWDDYVALAATVSEITSKDKLPKLHLTT